LPFDKDGVAGKELLLGLEYDDATEELQLELAACLTGCFRFGIGTEEDAIVRVCRVYGREWSR